jgi:signal transduction histidine kinase
MRSEDVSREDVSLEGSRLPDRSALAVLKGDRVFWLALGLLLVASAAYVLPLPEAPWVDNWRWFYGDIVYALAATLAAGCGLSRLRSPSEQRMWRLVTLAFGTMLAIEVLNYLIPVEVQSLPVGMAVESLYLIYYLALLLAASASRGNSVDPESLRLERFRAVGLGITGAALLLYFDGVSTATSHSGQPAAWSTDLFLFAVLDLLVCVAFFGAWRREEDARWRTMLAGIGLVSAASFPLDLAEGVLYLPGFQGRFSHPAWELPWLIPGVLLVLVARRHLGDPGKSREPSGRTEPPRPDRGSLIVGLILLPLLHTLLYSTNTLEPSLRAPREGVVFGFLVLMGCFTVYYLRALEKGRERGSAELALSEERYRSFAHSRSDALYRAEATPPVRLDQPFDSLVRALGDRLRVVEVGGPAAGLGGEGGGRPLGAPLVALLGADPVAATALLRRWIQQDFETVEMERSDGGAGPAARYFRYSLSGVVDSRGVRRAWLTVSDVTVERQSAMEAERLQIELDHARKMESLGTLAGGIAHDFNNLLLPIVGFTELALDGIDPGDTTTRENLRHVLRASKRGAELVDQVLAVSRKQPRRDVSMRVQDTVTEAIGLVRAGLPSTVAIDTAIDAACPPIQGDQGRIHQVLMNLCTNAGHSIGLAPGRMEISVHYDPHGEEPAAPSGWVVLTVRDDGPGVAPELGDRIFEPFFTTKEPGEGLGLGLATVHGIVTGHGGTVSVTTPLGGGAEFCVRIPACGLSLDADVARADPGHGGSRVMVVDDEPAISEVTTRMLEMEGHAVMAFTSSRQALSVLKANVHGFDLLVTDQTMPMVTGRELAAAARERHPRIAVVIMSGYHLRAEDFTDDYVYLDKPFTRERLSESVRAALALSLRNSVTGSSRETG